MQQNIQTAETTQSATTRSVGIKYGLIGALVSIFFFFIPIALSQNPFKGVWNWTGIAASIVVLFLAHKNFKDNGDGFMSYGQGMAIGFWVALVSTIIALLVPYIYLTFIDDSPMTLFFEEQRAEMESKGTPEEAIEIAQEWTRKLFWPIGTFFAFCLGIIIALILTIFTQKKSQETIF